MDEGKFYSQDGQDAFLFELFKGKQEGCFVDVGAYDGISFSNTYFLEKHLHWKGICIEPNPLPFAKLRENRNCIVLNCGIGRQSIGLRFLAVEGHGEMLSGFIASFDERHIKRVDEYISLRGGAKKEIEVEVFPLESILEKHDFRVIDYCNIDVEGGEMDVLKSIDFSKTIIRVLSVENNYGSQDVQRYLKPFGYRRINKIGADEFFELNSKNYHLMIRLKLKSIKKFLSSVKHKALG